MPMFFMLSGFALAVTYGRQLWAAPAPCCAVFRRCSLRQHQSQPQPNAVPASLGRPATAAVEEGRGAEHEQERKEQEREEDALPAFPLRSFYLNRFARVMPVYYFTLLLCLPLWIVNGQSSPTHSSQPRHQYQPHQPSPRNPHTTTPTVGDFPFARRTFIPSLITSVIPSTTLLSPLSGTYLAPLNPPGTCNSVIVRRASTGSAPHQTNY
jgi:hypothetical protein